MLTLSLVLLTFACGGRKSEPVEAPATPEGAPTLPVEGQPGPTITPTESQAAVHKALSVRDPEPECAEVSALTLSSRHVLLTDVQEIQTAEGDVVQRSRSIAWSPVASFDVGVGVCPGFAVSAGLDVPWFDPPGFSLPGAHINLIVGGWR